MKTARIQKRPVGRPSAETASQLDAALLAEASELFFKKGFSRTSMRDIAAKAAASRQTLYARFPNKMILFEALMEKRASELLVLVTPFFKTEGREADVLRHFAVQFVDRFVNSDLQRIHQMVISEASIFPDLARTFYERGPGRGRLFLREYLREQVGEGRMKINNVDFAAEQFMGSLLGPIIFRSTLALPLEFLDEEAIASWVDQAVSAFLSAYCVKRKSR